MEGKNPEKGKRARKRGRQRKRQRKARPKKPGKAWEPFKTRRKPLAQTGQEATAFANMAPIVDTLTMVLKREIKGKMRLSF